MLSLLLGPIFAMHLITYQVSESHIQPSLAVNDYAVDAGNYWYYPHNPKCPLVYAHVEFV